MRQITSHKVNGLNEALTITATDEPGPGGANHAYSIRWKNARDQTEPHCFLGFQNGPIDEKGVNGISNEALLAIVADRLKAFQSGSYACQDNALALDHVHDAIYCLHHRTRARVARGVEGTSAV